MDIDMKILDKYYPPLRIGKYLVYTRAIITAYSPYQKSIKWDHFVLCPPVWPLICSSTYHFFLAGTYQCK